MKKNIDDICELAQRLSNFIGEAQMTGIDFNKEDLDITVHVSDEELKLMDKELYEMTNKGGEEKPYTEANKVEATILGIKITLVKRQAVQ